MRVIRRLSLSTLLAVLVASVLATTVLAGSLLPGKATLVAYGNGATSYTSNGTTIKTNCTGSTYTLVSYSVTNPTSQKENLTCKSTSQGVSSTQPVAAESFGVRFGSVSWDAWCWGIASATTGNELTALVVDQTMGKMVGYKTVQAASYTCKNGTSMGEKLSKILSACVTVPMAANHVYVVMINELAYTSATEGAGGPEALSQMTFSNPTFTYNWGTSCA